MDKESKHVSGSKEQQEEENYKDSDETLMPAKTISSHIPKGQARKLCLRWNIWKKWQTDLTAYSLDKTFTKFLTVRNTIH